MRILALDPSSTNVGFCLASGTKYLTSGNFAPQGQPDERVSQIVGFIRGEVIAFKPDVVVMEEPAGDHGNRKIDRLLARVGGAIEAVALLEGCQRIARVFPKSVKSTKCCKDNLAYAAGIAGKVVGPDEADAIGVWLAWLAKR